MRITRVRAENLRSLKQIDLELRPFTVVIGPNGAGKSSFLELVNLFAGAEEPANLINGLSRWGGYHATLRFGAGNATMKIGVTLSDDENKFDYDIELMGEGGHCFVRSENLSRTAQKQRARQDLLRREDANEHVYTKDGQFIQQRTNHGPSTDLGRLRVTIPDVEPVLSVLKRITLWPVHKFQPSDRVRGPQQLQPTKMPALDGSNLFSSLYAMKTEQRHSYNQLLESLRAAVPELEDLEFPLAGAGHVNMTWTQRNFDRPFYSNQLSDGTLRLLWLVTVLYTVPDDGLVLLDEPELSLHPQWLMLLVSILRKTSARTNVLVATQSAEFIRWVQPEELVIADMTEDGATFSRVNDRADLAQWLEDFTLAQLWTMGELGGRR